MGRLAAAQDPLLGRGPREVSLGPGSHPLPREGLHTYTPITAFRHCLWCTVCPSVSVNKDLLNSFTSSCVSAAGKPANVKKLRSG